MSKEKQQESGQKMTAQQALDNLKAICASDKLELNLRSHAALQESLRIIEDIIKKTENENLKNVKS